jgi:hypothetical protein
LKRKVDDRGFSENVDVPQLHAAWPGIWGSYVRLVHSSNNTFTIEVSNLSMLFPHGYGRNQSPFEAGITGEVIWEFVIENKKVIGFRIEGEIVMGRGKARLGGELLDPSSRQSNVLSKPWKKKTILR